jgi:16S rRNA (adenine1518-N6/adenine1519-N6)-dimethyltransferase
MEYSLVTTYTVPDMKAKKSLGQNFLKSHAALKKMVSSAGAGPTDTILEIGPGKGALTKELLASGAHILAIEKDDRLIPYLQELFEAEIKSGQLELIHGDALEFDPRKYKLQKYKIVANIPYYITGLLIRTYLESPYPPEGMTILVQKEVAERIVARDGKESILSLSVKLFGTPFYKGVVSKRYFSPQPKVDSAILHIANITKTVSKKTADTFFIIIKQAFSQKRKTLLHTLGDIYSRETIGLLLQQLNKKELARPEELSLSDWLSITEKLESK